MQLLFIWMSYSIIGNSMKKYAFLFIITFCIVFLTNCERDPAIYHYAIENQSGVDIKLKIYYRTKDDRAVDIKYLALNNGQKIEKTHKNYGAPDEYYFADFFEINNEIINTVEVIYDSHRRTVFEQQRVKSIVDNKCEILVSGEEVPCNPRNFLNIFYYQGVNEHYIFTAEDYEEAEDCNGDCE